MQTDRFTLDDFMAQLRQVRRLGPMGKIVTKILGTKTLNVDDWELEQQMRLMQAIYHSMTINERRDTDLLRASRRRRIADGAGVLLEEVSQFLRQFEMSRDMMRQVRSMIVVQKFRVMVALVTNSPVHRDPSYALPASLASWWWVLAFLLGLLALAVTWFGRWRP